MPPRIPYRDENDPEVRELVEKIRARRRGNTLINLDRLLIHSPPYANGWNALLGAVRRDLEIDPQIRELVICAVAKLNDAVKKLAANAEFRAAIEKVGARPVLSSPAEFASQVKSEIDRMKQLVQQRQIKLDE